MTFTNGTVQFGATDGIVVNANGGSITFTNSANISGSGGLTVGGNGTLNINNSNTFTGGTFLDGGILSLGNNLALNTGTVTGTTLTITNGTLQTNLTAGLLLTNNVVLNNATLNLGGTTGNSLVFSGTTVGSSVTFFNMGVAGTSDTLTVSVPTVISGIISGAANLVKLGAAPLTLSGNNNTTTAGNSPPITPYSGITTLNSGPVFVQNATSLGTGNVFVGIGGAASVRFVGAFTVANSFEVAGTGDNGLGALQLQSGGSVTLSGTITMVANTTIDVNTGLSLTTSGTVSGGATLTKVGNGTLALSDSGGFASYWGRNSGQQRLPGPR